MKDRIEEMTQDENRQSDRDMKEKFKCWLRSSNMSNRNFQHKNKKNEGEGLKEQEMAEIFQNQQKVHTAKGTREDKLPKKNSNLGDSSFSYY